MAFISVCAPLFVSVLLLDMSNSGLKFWRWVCCPIPQLGAQPCLSSGYGLDRFFSPMCGISDNVIPIGSWEVLAFLAFGTFWLLFQIPILHCYTHCSISWPSVHLFHLIPYLILPFFSPCSLEFFSSISHPLLTLIVLFRFLIEQKHSLFGLPFSWASWSLSYIVGIPHSLPNIHLSVRKYHVYSFVVRYLTQDHIFKIHLFPANFMKSFF